jgi:hypothetical protein
VSDRYLRQARWLALGFAALLAVVTVMNAVYGAAHPLRTDFSDVYIQARVVLTVGWAHAYDPAALDQQRQLIRPEIWYRQNYPPLLILFILPFALLPLPLASWLWTAFVTAVLVVCWHVVTPAGRARERLAWLLVALALPPVMQAFRWQALLVGAVLGLALAWRVDRAGHQWTAGIILALAAVKPQLAFLLPVALLASGRWRTVVAGAATVLAMAAVAVAAIGTAGIGQWVDNIRTGLHDPMADLVEPYLGAATLIPRPYTYAFMAAVAAVVAVAAWRSRGAGVTVVYAVGLAGSQVAAPFIHPGDWAVTGLAVAILLAHTIWRWRRHVALASFVASLGVLGANGNPLGFVTLAWLVLLALDPIRSAAPALAQQEPGRPAVAPEPGSG